MQYYLLLESFKEFVQATVERYRHDFDQAESPELTAGFFGRFWKLFFDELLSEAHHLYDAHRQHIGNPECLRSDLQAIAENGLKKFKAIGCQ